MAYAIVGYFDHPTDSFIRSIWKELADNDICNYLFTSENDPHIKFSMHSEINLDKAIPLLSSFTNNHRKLTIHLKNYGFYPNDEPILFLDFSATIPLIQLENDIQKTFSPLGQNFDVNYFDENIWKPDCFLTLGIDKSKLQEGVVILLKKPLQFNGIIERLGIIEFHPAKQIVSYSLK
ncbi:MAG TPA: hypothetical protein VHY08_26685 [Bacillota bacterium]|nr:hypothetical protein [Bacillota bacterium]